MTARGAKCFPPATFIDEDLAERRWPRADFLDTLTPKQRADVIDVLEGRQMSPRAAVALSKVLGGSIEFWFKLDALWREWQTREAHPPGRRRA